MRIRKRKVPFPLSSLSPVPISDPLLLNLNRPPPPSPVVVQLHNYDPSQNDALNPLGNPSLGAADVTAPLPQPSDRPINHHLSPIGRGIITKSTDGCDFSGADTKVEIKIKKKEEDGLELSLKDEEKNNDISKGSISSAEVVSGFHFPESSNSSSPPQVMRRWCEGEKAFPLKKRRGSFLVLDGETTTTILDKKKNKTKTTKKPCNSSRKNDDVVDDSDQHHVHHQQSQDYQPKEAKDEAHHQQGVQLGNNINGGCGGGGGGGKNNNKKARGGVLMEGSRCSRVNGRGWRCCQQTLVGYSLCEHHLGKGRLRSMTSVRSRSLAKTTMTTTKVRTGAPLVDGSLSSSSSVAASRDEEEEKETEYVEKGDDNNDNDNDDDDDDEDDDDYGDHDYDYEKKRKPLMITKKRMKLGMVKARSMSSLLGQTNTSGSSTTGAIVMGESK